MKINWRAIGKAVTWRFVATTTTIIVAFFLTGSFELSIGIGILESVLKIFLYYLHEGIWEKVRLILENGENGV